MPRFKPKLRWFQFRLRSLLVLTLAIALWLGWELRQTDLIGGHVAAIREIGGTVELESSPWSLLRYVDASKYGRRAGLVEIPIARAGDALPHLKNLSGLREVRLATDGTFELHAIYANLLEALPGTRVSSILWNDPVSVERRRSRFYSDLLPWPRLRRFVAKVEQKTPGDEHLLPLLKRYLRIAEPPQAVGIPYDEWQDIKYHLVPLEDGSVGELLTIEDRGSFGTQRRVIAILLVHDEVVDAKYLWSGKIEGESATVCAGNPVVEDIDGDGRIEVGFKLQENPEWLPYPPLRVGGDRRLWNCIYRVEA